MTRAPDVGRCLSVMLTAVGERTGALGAVTIIKMAVVILPLSSADVALTFGGHCLDTENRALPKSVKQKEIYSSVDFTARNGANAAFFWPCRVKHLMHLQLFYKCR